MGREASMKPEYKILAYLTTSTSRNVGGAPLSLQLKDEQELKDTTVDIAKALKADVVKLTNGDYMVIYV